MKLSAMWAELRFVLAALIVSLLAGYLTGYWAAFITIGLFACIFWQLRQMMRLRAWLSAGAPMDNTPDSSGAVCRIVAHICRIKKHNASQQMKIEHVLRRFDAVARAMPDALLVVDEFQAIEWANPASRELLGIDRQRDIGRRIDNIVRDPDITGYLQKADFDEPLEFSSARSSDKDLILRVAPYDSRKKLLIVHDHGDLLRLQKVRKAFVSNASHEMRTPLTVIIGYLEVLSLGEELNAVTRQAVDGALEQAQRLKTLIEDLLSLSRLESLPLSRRRHEKVAVVMLVYESIELLKSSNIFKNQIFELRLDDAVQVEGDYRELQSAIQNVLDNAVKYSPPNALIEIDWQCRPDKSVALKVKNYGEGIEDIHIPRLTERFYRVDKGRSRDMGGTGLGLSIVKHVMERHDGQLTIFSHADTGTAVTLSFPAERACQQPIQTGACLRNL